MNFHAVLHQIEEQKIRRESGLLNCIPSPFPRFSEYWAGIERAKYSMVTANSKVGKSQITDFMFVHHPINFILENETNIDVKVLYFSLEMSVQQKILQVMSHMLHRHFGTYRSPKQLRSLKAAIDQESIDHLKKLDPVFDKYFQKVTFIDNIRNRYGIWLEIFEYAKQNGEIIWEDKIMDGQTVKVIKEYIPKNPDLITIILVDHVSLLNPEHQDTLHQAIGKMSSQDFVKARNIFGFSPVIIQQQASDQENLDHKKANALMPSLAGLGDNKMTQRDVDMAFGLFAPSRHEMLTFKGYDISKFGDRFRALNILANREDGAGNEICPLYFRGECSYFQELPKPNTQELKDFNP